jgi:hypothetical protein
MLKLKFKSLLLTVLLCLIIIIITTIYFRKENLKTKFESRLVNTIKRQLQDENTSTEVESEDSTVQKEMICANYANPKSLSECQAIDLTSIPIFGKKHTCCIFKMVIPKETFTCVPVEIIFLPLVDLPTNLNLPGNINIQGTLNCNDVFLFTNFVSLVILTLFLQF